MEKKYIPLAAFFQQITSSEVTLTYQEIETIMGQQLPNAAYLNSSWWFKHKAPFSHFEAWANAGYSVKKVHIGSEITFSNEVEDRENTNSTQNALIVREFDLNDARTFIQLQQILHKDGTTLSQYGANEYEETVQAVRKEFTRLKKFQLGTYLVCVLNGSIIGFMTIVRDEKTCYKHVANLHIYLAANAKNEESVDALLRAGENWATDHQIKKYEMYIPSVEHFYETLLIHNGYEKEAIRKASFYYNDHIYDELLFSKFF
jgi:RimJ/RimL family protein N-acetyltransferase